MSRMGTPEPTSSAAPHGGARAPTWAASGERSNMLALRLMGWIAVTLGRPVARLVLHPIALYFLCFAPTSRRHSARYLARALGRAATWRDQYRHFHAFASIVLDRVYFVRGHMSAFDISVRGGEWVDERVAEGKGVILLGAHLGSFEALHAIRDTRPGLRVAMVMYPDNARMIHSVLRAIAPEFKLSVIAIGRSGSTLQIRDTLASGCFVGLLGDRFLGPAGGTGSARTGSVELPFLGTPARFTEGPLRLAMLLKRPVYFMVGLYRGGRRYELIFEPLADFSLPMAAGEREARIRAALVAYVARLEALCREAPYNWFNFFDYWTEDGAA